MGRVTLVSVAERAGVSIATVSKVINGVAKGVSIGTRERVLGIVREMGYRPNRAGRALRFRRHYQLGFVVVDPNPRFLADPFISNVVAGLAQVARSRNFGLGVAGLNPVDFPTASFIRESEFDGVVLLQSGTSRQRSANLRRLLGAALPVVVLQEPRAKRRPEVFLLSQDDYGAARSLAARHFAAGRRVMLCITPTTNWAPMEERRRAAADAAAPAGATLIDLKVDEHALTEARQVIRAAVATRPDIDCIFAGNDVIAIAALRACRDLGRAVPGHVAINGFNGFLVDLVDLGEISTVRSKAYELGLRAGDVLIDRVEHGRFAGDAETMALDEFVL